MSAVFQHPRELVLSLFLEQPSFPITVLAQRELVIGSWTVQLNIIGESHAVVISHRGDPVFSEVLACYPLPKHRCYYAYEFDNMNAHDIHIGPYYGRVSFRLPEWDIPQAKPGNSITHHFPAIHGETPKTQIQWVYEYQRLQWWTLHTYPLGQEIIYVYTLSQYDFASQQGS